MDVEEMREELVEQVATFFTGPFRWPIGGWAWVTLVLFDAGIASGDFEDGREDLVREEENLEEATEQVLNASSKQIELYWSAYEWASGLS